MNKKKVIIVGIDGACWELINLGISKSLLPTFAYLVQNSVYGDLKSVLPPISPSAWNSIYTGAFPDTTGIFNFFDFDSNLYSYKPISSESRKVPTIFALLSLYSYKVFGINLPFYYPPEIVNGCLISGFGSPIVKTYPPNFLKKIREFIPHFIGDIGDEDIILSRNKVSLKKKVERIFGETEQLIKYFFENKFDFGFFVFRAHEPLKHYYFDDLDFILFFYLLVDKILEKILFMMSPNDILLIVSDHGFKKVNCYLRINNVLESLGFFKCNQKIQLPILEKVGKILLNINPQLARRLLSSAFVWRLLKKFPNRSLSYLNSVDWEKTKAFYLEGSEGIIKINLKGRERRGSVAKEEYEQIRKEIISKMQSLQSNNGQKVVKRVVPIEEIYSEKAKKYGDLIVLLEKDYVPSGGYNPKGEIFDFKKALERPGEHSVDGIFMIYSKNKTAITEEKSLFNTKSVASVVDIAPTVLSIFGVPVPNYMNGKSILKKEYQKVDSKKVKLLLKINKLQKRKKLMKS